MTRLVNTNGVVVNVSEEKAERLLAAGGYAPADEPAKKAPAAKKAAARKSAS